jgi:glycosyltransferase involved in cell wall biosynthesis
VQGNEPTVAIFGQLLPGSAGGIETNLLCLLKALASVESPGHEIVIGPGGASDWLLPHLAPTQSVLPCPAIRCDIKTEHELASGKITIPGLIEAIKVLVGRGRVSAFSDYGRKLTKSLRERGVKVVHFPYQRYFPTDIPFIFEPWDLQHIHLPEFFSAEEIEFREYLYRRACKEASIVATASQATKRDLVKHFSVPPDKIAVIPRGAGEGLQHYPVHEAQEGIASLGLPERFALYPAKTWPHKNHSRLFQALSLLKKKGIHIPLVCTGKPVESTIESIKHDLKELDLDDLVIFTGYVDDAILGKLYSCAQMMVFPSLFEGLGIPVLEAMKIGLPVALSDASCLPEIAGTAAVYFDPYSPEDIAEKMAALWMNDALRSELRVRAAQQISSYSWGAAAKSFRICYKYLAGNRLRDDEKKLFSKLFV